MKVLIGTSTFGAAGKAPLDRLVEAGLEPVFNPYGRKIAGAELPPLLTADTVGIIAGLETLNGEVLASSRLKVISRVGVGLSSVDLAAAKDLGIHVYSTPDAPTQAVAELTVGAMLSLLRHLPVMNSKLHDGKWERPLGRQLDTQVVAVVGFGRTGRRIGELLEAFGAHVIAVGRAGSKASIGGRQQMPLEDALARADIVTVHASGEECVLDERAFGCMKQGALVLNASRGTCVDEAALVGALDSGKVAGAWLDVFDEEPYAGPLTRYANVILTPHAGSNTAECRIAMEAEAVENLIEGLTKAGVL